MVASSLHLALASVISVLCVFFFFQAEDGIRDVAVTGVQTCALPISGKIGRGDHRLVVGAVARRGVGLAPAYVEDLQARVDRKSVVVGKECRSRWSPYH